MEISSCLFAETLVKFFITNWSLDGEEARVLRGVEGGGSARALAVEGEESVAGGGNAAAAEKKRNAAAAVGGPGVSSEIGELEAIW